MEIKTKLSIGDPIVVISLLTNEIKETCIVCKGEKEINLEGYYYTCPKCHGDGFKRNYEPKCWRIWESSFAQTPSKVKKISIEIITKNKIDVCYFPWGTSGNFFHEQDCFKTIKEAQAECDRRNAEGSNSV